MHIYTDGAWTPPDAINPYNIPAGSGVAEFQICADGPPCEDRQPNAITDNIHAHTQTVSHKIYPLGQILYTKSDTNNYSTDTRTNISKDTSTSSNTYTNTSTSNNIEHDSCEKGQLMWTSSVQVDDDEKSPTWIGAAAHTNNTGEMTAMHIALTRTLTVRGIGPRPGIRGVRPIPVGDLVSRNE